MASDIASKSLELVSFSLAGCPLAVLASQSAGLASPNPQILAQARQRRAWLLDLLQYPERPDSEPNGHDRVAIPDDERPYPFPSPQPSPRGRGGKRALRDFHAKQVLILKGREGGFPLSIDGLPLLQGINPSQLRPLPELMAQVSSLPALRGFLLDELAMQLLLDPAALPVFVADVAEGASGNS